MLSKCSGRELIKTISNRRMTACVCKIMKTVECPLNISKLSVYYLILIITFSSRTNGARNVKDEAAPGETDAIQRLSKVFGIDNVPRHSVKATPPQFMLELFNDITDYGGLIRKDGPYNASTIISFPDKGRSSIYFLNCQSYRLIAKMFNSRLSVAYTFCI